MSQVTTNSIVDQSGASFLTDISTHLKALASSSKGISAPGSIEAGMFWVDDSVSPWKYYMYDGDTSILVGTFDPTSNTFSLAVAQGGTGAATASAARTNLGLVIGTDVQADLAIPSQAEAEAGTATNERVWTAVRVKQAIAALANTGLPRSYLAGLALSNNATDAVNDIDITAGTARNAGNDGDLTLAAAVGKRIDASWASGGTPGTPTGGLSSSLTLANDTWYHTHLIRVSGTVGVGLDTSVTAANLIADHGATKYRRIGSVRRATATNLTFIQNGDTFYWKGQPPQDINANTSLTRANVTLTVPPLVVEAIVSAHFDGVSGGSVVHVWSPDADNYTIVGGNGVAFHGGIGSVTASMGRVLTSSSGQVSWKSNIGARPFDLATLGYVDRRGRDD